MNACATCKHFQFKYSGDHAWGQCIQPKMLTREIMQIYLGHVDTLQRMDYSEANPLEQEIKDYGRVYFREDMFGCILHEADADALEQIAEPDQKGRA